MLPHKHRVVRFATASVRAALLFLAFSTSRADWLSQDIGTVGTAGDSVYDEGSGTYTVTGAGLGVTGTADALHYVYRTIDSDGEITVAISSLSSESPYTAAGLMIRESLNANSKQAFLSVSDQDGVNFVSRNSTGGNVLKTLGPSLEAPVWLRIQRVGASILGFVSSNGVNWTLIGRTDVEFATGNYYVGFGVSSAVSGTLATGVFGQLMCLGNLPYGISGMRLWLRADAGVLSGTGGLVTDWEDQSGNGNHAQQGALANQPVWIDDQVNGLPTLQFNGTSSYLSIADTTSLKPSQLTVFVVGRHTGGSTNGLYLAKTGSSTLNDGYSISRLTSGSNVGITISGTASATSLAVASGTYSILSGKYDLSKVRFSFNGGTPAVNDFATAITHSNQSLYLGGLPASNRLQGNISEILIFGRALSSIEQKKIESYLGGKYGISSGLSFGVPSGTYSETQSVSLIAPQGSAIYFTMDGSTPTTSSSLYTGPISISTTTLLKAIYVQNGGPASAVASELYTIDPSSYLVSRDGLALWLRADVGVSGTSAVTKWIDQSGNGNDAIPPTAPDQPTLQAGVLGGKPVLRFNGNSYMTLGSGLNRLSALPLTLVIVTKNSTNPDGLFDSAPGLSNEFRFSDNKVEFANSSPFVNFTLSSTGSIATIMGQVGGGGSRLMTVFGNQTLQRSDQRQYNTTGSGTTTLSNPLGSIASVTLWGTADDYLSLSGTGITDLINNSTGTAYQTVNISFTHTATDSFSMNAPNPSGGFNAFSINVRFVDPNYVPGQPIAGSTSPVFFSNPQIGRRDTKRYYTGDIAEILFYQRAITSADRIGLEGYLIQKYGVGILPSLAAPTFSPPSATYALSQSVSINVPAGATVYYTTDGSPPNLASAIYSAPIPVNTTTTIRAIAVKTGYQTTGVISATYAIDSNTSSVPRNGLQLWLRADSFSGTTGSLVGQWADESGSLQHAIQGTSGNQPTLQTGVLNGKPVMRFDGTNDYISATAGTAWSATQHSVFFVLKPNSVADYNQTFSALGGWGQFLFHTTTAGGVYVGTSGSSRMTPGTGAGQIPNGTITINTWQLCGYTFNNGSAKFYKNANTIASATLALPANWTGFALGSNSSNTINGDVAEVLVYNTALTDTQRQNVEDYLNTKYNLGLSIPLAAPVLSSSNPPAGTLNGSSQNIAVDLVAGVDIRYTLDGSDPTISSALYSVPIGINATTTLKFKAFRSGFAASPTTSVTYTFDSQTIFTRNGLALWLRADQGVTVVSGSSMSQWSDISGLGNNASQLTGNNQPTLQTSQINGKPVIRFDGSNDFLSVPDATSLKPSQLTTFVVGRHTGGNNNGVYLVKASSSSLADGYAVLRANGGSDVGMYVNGSASTASVLLGSSTYAIMSGRYDAQQVRFGVNGGTAATTSYTAAITHSTQPLYLGSFNGSNNKVAGDIAEVLIFNRALTDSERLEVEYYLYQRYNTGSAPALPAPKPLSANPPQEMLLGSAQYIGVDLIPGADIRYTLSGTDPTVSSPVYSGSSPISINATTTLKFKAFRTGYTTSPTTTLTYTFDSQAVFPRSGLALWLRADKWVTESGGSVSQWNDMSGFVNNAVQSSNSKKPTLQTSQINGKPIIRFDGSNDFLSVPDATSLKPSQLTTFVVGRHTGGDSNGLYLVKASSSSLNDGYAVFRTTSGSNVGMYVNGSASTASVPLGSSTYAVMSGRYDAQQVRFGVNGGTAATTPYTTAITHSTEPLYLGSRDSDDRLAGDIAEVLVFNRALTDSERLEVESYLYQRYNTGTAPPLPAPTCNPGASVYTSGQSVVLTATDGATIYYTTSGSTPTTGSSVYSAPIPISTTTTLKAIAVKAGYQTSGIMSATFTIDLAANFNRNGLKLWLRADQGLTVTGSAVSQWNDLSGNSNTAMQLTGTNQPVVISGTLNGQSVLRFDGTNDYLSIADSASLKPASMTAYVVGKQSSGGTSGILLAKSGSTAWTNGYGFVREGSGNSFGYFINNNATVKATGTITANNYFVAQAAYAHTTVEDPLNPGQFIALDDWVSLQINGQPLAPVSYKTAISHTTQPLLLGGNGAATYSLGGDIAEVLLFNRKLTLAEQIELEKYLETRYAISSDADGDGLPRWRELELGSDPANADTNGNGLNDGAEYNSGFSPTSNDSDNDGLTNSQEYTLGTNAFWADSDGDGVNDGSDAYPLDATVSSNTDPTPSVAPTITLELPTNAVLLP